jgi:hypothetical protein
MQTKGLAEGIGAFRKLKFSERLRAPEANKIRGPERFRPSFFGPVRAVDSSRSAGREAGRTARYCTVFAAHNRFLDRNSRPGFDDAQARVALV